MYKKSRKLLHYPSAVILTGTGSMTKMERVGGLLEQKMLNYAKIIRDFGSSQERIILALLDPDRAIQINADPDPKFCNLDQLKLSINRSRHHFEKCGNDSGPTD
jgi:hypothetical protein